MKPNLRLVALLAAALTGLPSVAQAPQAPAANATADSEAAAWKAVKEATRPPLPPSEWNDQKPTDAEYATFRKKMGDAAADAADLAKEFAVKYPNSNKLAEAQELRLGMLQAAVQLGLSERTSELKELGGAQKETQPTNVDPFVAKMQAAVNQATQLQAQGMEAMLLEFEKGVREAMKEFPDRPEVYAALLQVAEGLGGDRAKSIAQEIAASDAPKELKQLAAALLKKQEIIGQSIDLQFTALDGRTVNLADLKGKVVLVDFWATWCGPCVAELPKVKAAYDRLNSQGFEIIGISFDEDKESLESFVKKKAMAWPQYFDGSGWKNKFGQQYGIQGIPTMWLIDKQGKVRDLNARENLTGKVEKLLAEK